MTNSNRSRRTFLRNLALGAGAALALPAVSYARMAGAADRFRVAVMGVNERGDQLARLMARLPAVEITHICDVDSRAAARTAAAVEGVQHRRPTEVTDFRRVLDDDSVDALVIAAPDHWHAPATILACNAGKHVYVEKPASHNPQEGEWMVAAARKYDRVVQLGNQRRSWPNIVDAMAALREGVIGEVRYSRSWYARARTGIGRGKPAPVPAWLDYELWQGPAPRLPFRDNVIHYNWHWFWNWGTGEAGNNGIHTVDLSRWGLGATFPVRVSATGGRLFFDDDAQTPDTQVLTFEFPDGRYAMWEGQSTNAHGMEGGVGVSFHGTEGSLVIRNHDYRVFDRDDRLVREVNPQNGREATDSEGRTLGLDEVHLYNFVEAVRNGARPNSEIEEGYRSTLLCLLGNISHRTGRILHCDPVNGHIVDDPEAAALWGREYAPGWQPKV